MCQHCSVCAVDSGDLQEETDLVHTYIHMYMQLLEMMHGIIMQMHRQQHFGEGDLYSWSCMVRFECKYYMKSMTKHNIVVMQERLH